MASMPGAWQRCWRELPKQGSKVRGTPSFGVRQHAAALPLRDMSRGFAFTSLLFFCSGKQPINTNKLRTTCRVTAKRCRATALQRGRFATLKLFCCLILCEQFSHFIFPVCLLTNCVASYNIKHHTRTGAIISPPVRRPCRANRENRPDVQASFPLRYTTMDSCNESRYQRPSFLSDHFSFPRIRALLLALCVAAAPSLLPASTEIVHVAFSSDGRYLASLDNEGTLYVDDADSRKPLLVVRGSVKGNDFAWRPGKNQIAAAMDVGQGWDIYLINLDGTRKRLTDHPALDSSPQWALDGRKLAFLSTRNDKLNLFELDPETLSVQALDTRAGSVWNPMVQPGGESLAYFSIDTGDIQLWLSSPGREPVMLAPVDPALQYQEDLDIAWDSAGDQLLYVERDMLKDQPRVNLHAYDLITRENKLLAAGPSISNLLSYSSSGALFYRSDKGLQMFPQWRGRHSGKLEAERPFRPNGFSLDHPALSSTAKFAAVVEGNGIALAPTLQAEFNYSFFSAEGYLAQAERLYETGKEREAEAVYALLEKAEPEPGRVIRVRIHHAAQLRKKARYAEALNVLNTLDTLLPPSGKVIPTTSTLDLSQPAVQRGMLACFEQRDFDKARQLFLNAGARRSAPSSQEPMPPSGDAIETAMEAPQRGPLAILQTHNLPLIRLWAEAHAALRNGNVAGCLENMLRLAKQFGSHPAVVDAVLDLFEDPYFSEHLSKPGNPFARPENQTKVVEILLTLEKAGHPTSAILRVIPFTESSPSSEASASRVRLSEEMLQTLVKARQFTPAIDTAQRMLQEGGPGALGVAESLLFYLESERSDPYGRDLITQVMLSPKMVTALESALRQDPVSLSMLQLARIKQALLAGDVKTVQPLLVSTQQIFQGFSNETFTREIARLQTYLYLFAAKRFERQGEWDKA
ncbi:TPA: hypothetical protein DDW35_06955, partial [Candidatus Sumerlaeota bacterium]|nr:hypothetical protein [Candidatus Sumerlaeota bacterium]